MRATFVASTSVGFSRPSMKPVRSRSWGLEADDLVDEVRHAAERDYDRARQVEHDVVRRAGEPDDHVVLRGRHDETGRTGDRLVEPGYAGRRVVRCGARPEFRSEAGDQVDPADRRPRFA